MLRINPGLVLLSCFCLALYLMIGSVEDWGRLSNGLGNLRVFFSSLCGLRIGVFLSLDCTLIAKHQEDYQ